MVLATIAVLLRLVARRVSATKYGNDDLLIVLALVSALVSFISYVLTHDENLIQRNRSPTMVGPRTGFIVLVAYARYIFGCFFERARCLLPHSGSLTVRMRAIPDYRMVHDDTNLSI